MTWWTFPPRGSQARAAAVLFVEAASEMAVVVSFLDTTPRGCCGETGLSTLLARCQETRSPPCLCASKFHCLRRHPTLAAWLLALSRGRGSGVRVGGTPAPLFPVGTLGGPAGGAAAPLSQSWAPGSPLTPGWAGHVFSRDGAFTPSEEGDSGPQVAPGCRSLWKARLFRIPSLYKFSHDVSGARGRVRTAGKRRAVRMSSSVTCKE